NLSKFFYAHGPCAGLAAHYWAHRLPVLAAPFYVVLFARASGPLLVVWVFLLQGPRLYPVQACQRAQALPLLSQVHPVPALLPVWALPLAWAAHHLSVFQTWIDATPYIIT